MKEFSVELQCPQCGAPAELEETERLFACPFCRVKSFLVGKSFFRYVLPANAPQDAELLWIPYWHFRGMTFSFIDNSIQHRVADTSVAAVHHPTVPESLGIRSQTLKLRFLTDKEAGAKGKMQNAEGKTRNRRIKPLISFSDATKAFQSRYETTKADYQCQIGERVSLIYAPFYLNGALFDGILNRPLAGDADGIADLETDQLAQEIRFVPTLCPNCGWDLEGSPGTLALGCRNCQTMWQAGGQNLERLPAAHIPSNDPDAVYMPFWRIQAEVSGIILHSYADLVQTANLPKAPQPEWDDIPFYFWSPAFKCAPQNFLRLGYNMTIAQPGKALSRILPNGETHPVSMPVTQAVESLKMTLAAFIRPRKKLGTRLRLMDIQPKRALLVYVPLRQGPHELIHDKYKLTVNRNMLKLTQTL